MRREQRGVVLSMALHLQRLREGYHGIGDVFKTRAVVDEALEAHDLPAQTFATVRIAVFRQAYALARKKQIPFPDALHWVVGEYAEIEGDVRRMLVMLAALESHGFCYEDARDAAKVLRLAYDHMPGSVAPGTDDVMANQILLHLSLARDAVQARDQTPTTLAVVLRLWKACGYKVSLLPVAWQVLLLATKKAVTVMQVENYLQIYTPERIRVILELLQQGGDDAQVLVQSVLLQSKLFVDRDGRVVDEQVILDALLEWNREGRPPHGLVGKALTHAATHRLRTEQERDRQSP